MKKNIVISLLIIVSLLLFSCNAFPYSAVSNKDEKSAGNIISKEKVELGDKIYNPFSISNMMERGVDISEEGANWYYFRVRSESLEAESDEGLKFLKDRYDFLETVPLDYEIKTGGYYYDDPEIDEDTECPWIYFMKPVEEYEAILNSGYDFKIEILDKMYVEEGLLEALQNSDDEKELERFVTISSLKRMQDNDPARWFGGIWGSPQGYVYFDDYDGALNQDDDFITKAKQPLYGVEVASSQLILTDSCVTDKNGHYFINRSYGSWFGNVRIRLIFRNSRASFNGLGKWWEFICDAYEYVGNVNTSDVTHYNIFLNNNDNKRANRLANYLDAVNDYYDFCYEMGVNTPSRCMRIWLIDDGNGNAVTLYAREGLIKDLFISLGGFGFFGGPFTGLLTMSILAVVSNFFPDIVITGCSLDYLDVFRFKTLWHELSHASHFGASGTAYLDREYFEMLGNLPHYPENSDLVDVIESWGYFAEYYILQWYKNKLNNIMINNLYLKMSDFYSHARGYSCSFAELLNKYPKIKIKDIFNSIIGVKSIDCFVNRISINRELTTKEIEEIKVLFFHKAPLN